MKKIELIAAVILEDGEGEAKQNVTNYPGAVLELDDATADKLIAEGKAREFNSPSDAASPPAEESSTSAGGASEDSPE